METETSNVAWHRVDSNNVTAISRRQTVQARGDVDLADTEDTEYMTWQGRTDGSGSSILDRGQTEQRNTRHQQRASRALA